MRHYFGYDINGALRSIENYGPAGWPANFRMDDPDCTADVVTSLRERRASKNPEIIGWVLFDCQCDASQGAIIADCKCCNSKFSTSYVDVQTKTLKTKPLRTVYIDSDVVNNGDIVTRAPGTVVTLKVAASLPDGEIVHCVQTGQVDLTLDDEWDLTFTNGVTDTKSLTAPAQGSRGAVAISGPRIRPMSFFLRGFA